MDPLEDYLGGSPDETPTPQPTPTPDPTEITTGETGEWLASGVRPEQIDPDFLSSVWFFLILVAVIAGAYRYQDKIYEFV